MPQTVIGLLHRSTGQFAHTIAAVSIVHVDFCFRRDFEGRPLRAEVSHGKKRRDEPRGDRRR